MRDDMRVQCVGKRSWISIYSHGYVGLELGISELLNEIGNLKIMMWGSSDLERVEVEVEAI
jgi:hypothetical protein